MAVMRAGVVSLVVFILCGCGSAPRSGQTATPALPAYLAVVEGPSGLLIQTLSAHGHILRTLGDDAAQPSEVPLWTKGHAEALWIGPSGIMASGVRAGTPRTIVPCKPACPTSFDLSPDGRTLAFSTAVKLPGHREGGELITVSLADGKQTVLRSAVNDVFYPIVGGWSPDGRSILYERLMFPPQGRTARAAFLELARRDGKRPRILVRVARPGQLRASWSPDGHRIAFVDQFGFHGDTRVGIVDMPSDRVRFLAAHPISPSMLPFAWAPDSERLAVAVVPPPHPCCGGGIAVFAAAGGLLHYTPSVTAEWLAWTQAGLFALRSGVRPAVTVSANGTRAPVRVFRFTEPRSTLLAVVPR